MVHTVSALVFVVLVGIIKCRTTTYNNDEEPGSAWPNSISGYVDVRPNAHMFYWLYYSTHPDGYQSRPWIIWLQGGPGLSSCGVGNFGEIGPRKPDLYPRNNSWIKQASVLFVDSPVGAGFSYVDDDSAYNNQDGDMIEDLIKFLKEFLRRMPDFQTYPLYIFGESYGGRIAAFLTRRLHSDIEQGHLNANLTAVVMGDPWISPLHSILKYADFAFWMSVVDENGRDAIREEAERARAAYNNNNFSKAYEYFEFTLRQISKRTNGVDVQDITKFLTRERDPVDQVLRATMDHLQKHHLNTTVPATIRWSEKYNTTSTKLRTNFLQPNIQAVDHLLQNTNLEVIVYQGQHSMLCNTEGTRGWIEQLKWHGIQDFLNTTHKPIINPVDRQTEAFVKAYGKLKLYTIIGAGYAAPADKSNTMYRILGYILNGTQF